MPTANRDTALDPALLAMFARRYGISLQELRQLSDYMVSGGPALEQRPVPVREFLESPEYMGAKGIIYPAILEALEELNSGGYEEAVLTGAIGAGKSTIALYTQAYQLYVLSCYRDPHALFGLDPSSEILIVFQNLNLRLAKAVEFDRFRDMLAASPYFTRRFYPDVGLDSELRFPRRIVVKPVTGLETGTIGQNVIGGVIDEVNFMSIVQRSARSVDGTAYDQATALYNSIARRRKSRFLREGRLPGMLCLVSSKRYPGEFTEQKIEEARRQLASTGRTPTFIYDRALWDAKPPGTYCGKSFRVFIGDTFRKPRIIGSEETLSATDNSLIREIPIEFLPEFERDPLNALRDIAGIPTRALTPFIVNTDALAACRRAEPPLLSRTTVDFAREAVDLYVSRFDQPELARWAHIDLALTGDSAGIAVGYASRFVDRRTNAGTVERLPLVHIDFVLEVVPPRDGEIAIPRIRELLYQLRRAGINIRWVTYDNFQSRESIQILRQQGFSADVVSVDRTLLPYEVLKSAIYDRRISLPGHEKLFRELLSLELHAAAGKVDHPPTNGGSKDLADAVAAVTYLINTRRETWAMHNEPLVIPESLATLLKPPTVTSGEYSSGVLRAPAA